MIDNIRNPESTCNDPSCSGGGGGGNAAGVAIPGGGARGGGGDENTGLQDERVLMLVFRSLNWDPHLVCIAACVSRRLRAVANRVLWRELCISRAPRMVSALTAGGGATRIGGGWHALAKLLFFCCGCAASTRFFPFPESRLPTPGHFAPVSRFSKTSGRSFLSRRCWGDLLYVSDPCEHAATSPSDEADLGAYRGVFRGFMRSRTRACLIGRQVELESRVRCPYCGARVWSMTAAGLVPRSASRRLGSHEGDLEYFVCVNGHLHGFCWLAHLSSTDDDDDEDHDDDDDDEEEDHDDDDDDDGHVAC
ncbi:EID1-like F-box protein 3 [Phoenix dactylifera]|uniref:EID1-like F-box protein 3 n=1 Tax=Phoenix dactylifera TaxID=42345 RepID=A0A8B8ZCJ4_PHODC|nr:EID1-like F-box protein 3 [Phoenix dactylifera]